MILSRILRSLIFPEIDQEYVDVDNLKNIEERNKDIRYLIKNLSNKNVSNQKKLATKRELQRKGVINYDKIPRKKKKLRKIRNIHCGKTLVF